mgnify:CR=1 FL=1
MRQNGVITPLVGLGVPFGLSLEGDNAFQPDMRVFLFEVQDFLCCDKVEALAHSRQKGVVAFFDAITLDGYKCIERHLPEEFLTVCRELGYTVGAVSRKGYRLFLANGCSVSVNVLVSISVNIRILKE